MFKIIKHLGAIVLFGCASVSALSIKDSEGSLEVSRIVFDVGDQKPSCNQFKAGSHHAIEVKFTGTALNTKEQAEIAAYVKKRDIEFNMKSHNGMQVIQLIFDPRRYTMSCSQWETKEEVSQLVITIYDRRMLQRLHKEQPLLRVTCLGAPSKAC